MKTEAILKVKNLCTYFLGRARAPVKAVDGVSYEVRPGEMVAIVGESGCGKTVGVLSLVRLNPPTSTIIDGEVLWNERDILHMPEGEIRRIRGKDVAIVFQNPLSSLNPLMTIGKQISEVLQIHHGLSGKDSWQESKRMLSSVSVPDVTSKMEAYPFQLSGGTRQRVMVAMALCCGPKLLIADEPTTSLDATIQAQILELMASANREAHRATILVTHDLGIVARYADRVYIMYAGHIVETANCTELYSKPLHPYTGALLKAVPRLDQAGQYKLVPIEGSPPHLDRLGRGCPFQPRCRGALKRCAEECPTLKTISSEHSVACWQIQN